MALQFSEHIGKLISGLEQEEFLISPEKRCIIPVRFAIRKNGKRPARNFFVDGWLSEDKKMRRCITKLITSIYYLSQHGNLLNNEQFKAIRGHSGLYEFRDHVLHYRLYCFYEFVNARKQLVLTHAAVKHKYKKQQRHEIDKALRIQAEDNERRVSHGTPRHTPGQRFDG